MRTVAVRAIERAIDTMRRDLGEPVTVTDLARAAMFSKYHFTRVFQQVTGLSPARYLSAMRIDQAKHLLVATSTSVADISHEVGYNSVGTFSVRFRVGVGLSPSAYRRSTADLDPVRFRTTPGSSSALRGTVNLPGQSGAGPILVGLFRGPIMEGVPARFTVLDGPGPYSLDGIPAGSWYVLAHSLSGRSWPEGVTVTGAEGPVTVGPDVSAGLVDIRLRPRCAFDPPVLTALLERGRVPAGTAREETALLTG